MEIINDYEQNEATRNESKSLINKSCISPTVSYSSRTAYLKLDPIVRVSAARDIDPLRYFICLLINLDIDEGIKLSKISKTELILMDLRN